LAQVYVTAARIAAKPAQQLDLYQRAVDVLADYPLDKVLGLGIPARGADRPLRSNA
jgi:hypothetical protein